MTGRRDHTLQAVGSLTPLTDGVDLVARELRPKKRLQVLLRHITLSLLRSLLRLAAGLFELLLHVGDDLFLLSHLQTVLSVALATRLIPNFVALLIEAPLNREIELVLLLGELLAIASKL